MSEFLRKWWPLAAVLLVFVVALCIILFVGNDAPEANYVNGVDKLELDGVTYMLINDVTKEEYIGSMVRSILSAERGEKIAEIKSFGLMVIAMLYDVVGDDTQKYVIDSTGRIYIKEEFYEAAKAELADEAAFTDYRMVGTDKSMSGLKELSIEQVEMIRDAMENGQEVSITDKPFIINYQNRREIFAFSEDGLLYRAELELFLYEETVFVTTYFAGNEDATKDQALRGVPLPEELGEQIKAIWN